MWSGWGDSNSRPPAPKAGALTKLRYTPYVGGQPIGLRVARLRAVLHSAIAPLGVGGSGHVRSPTARPAAAYARWS